MQKYRYFVQGASMREKQEGKKTEVDRFERALQRKPVKLIFMAYRSYLPPLVCIIAAQ